MSVKIKRVCESNAETELRNERNKLSMQSKRMCETENELISARVQHFSAFIIIIILLLLLLLLL